MIRAVSRNPMSRVSFPSSWLGALLVSAVGCVFAATSPAPAPPVAPAPITTIAGAFARWPELTSNDEPVRFEGVVTGTMPTGAFRMHDGELGIFVTKSAPGRGPKLTPGDKVAVSGVLRKGGFSPWISPHEVTVLGRAPFPEARVASYSVLASGAVDNQWVEIEGVVRGVQIPAPHDFALLDLGMSGGNLRVLVNYDKDADFNSLIDSAVRMRGVAAVNVNAHKHVVEPSFRVPGYSEIKILRAGNPDPFAQPLVRVKGLMRFSLGALHHHRVRTSGVVTRRLSDGMFFIRDGDVGLKVETASPCTVRTGDSVEVAGFPVMEEGMAVLQHATCRTLGVVPPPAPVEPTLATLLQGTHNSDLVTIPARLVDWVIAGRNITLVLQTRDQLFKALFTLPAGASPTLPEKDSLVNVTGICVISELEDIWFYQPRSFLVLLADLSDLQLVQAPPWWNPERLWRALVITGLVLLAVAGWVWSLRRQIERKRAVIEQQARHAAALEERSRIARELHDTLEQGLTGLSLQMKAMETDLHGTPHPVQSRLQFARQMLRQSRALARNAIRELRSETLPSRLEGLVDGLKRVADSWNQSGVLNVGVAVAGKVRPLPPPLERHLLGIGTEAITNAVKHGQATFIQVEIAFRTTEIALRINDNGTGFDPAPQLEHVSGCFGLLGMRERAREVRGEIRIHSELGKGTEIIVTVPIAPETEGSAVAAKPDHQGAPVPNESPAV
jgi:signal transduction histidine kinase